MSKLKGPPQRYFIITGAYLSPGEGPVEPYGWSGAAATCEKAVKDMQEQCIADNDFESKDDPIEVIDIWEVHPDDVAIREADHHAYVRMRSITFMASGYLV